MPPSKVSPEICYFKLPSQRVYLLQNPPYYDIQQNNTDGNEMHVNAIISSQMMFTSFSNMYNSFKTIASNTTLFSLFYDNIHQYKIIETKIMVLLF